EGGQRHRPVQAAGAVPLHFGGVLPHSTADRPVLRHLGGFRGTGGRLPGLRRGTGYTGLAAWQLGHPQRCAGLGTAAGRRPQGAAEHGDCQRPALRHHHAAVGRGHVARPGDREPSPEGQPEQPQRRPRPVAQASGRHSHLSGEGRSGTVHQGHRPDRHDPRRQGTSGTVLARRGPLRRGTYPRLSGGGIRSARFPLRDSPARVPASGLRQPETSETADADSHYYRAEVFLRRGGLAYDVYGYEDKELISDILDHFEKYLDFLQLSPGVLPWNMAEHDELLNTPKES